MKKWILAMALAASICGPAWAQSCGNGRTMSLATFMRTEFSSEVPLQVYVPEEYEHVDVEGQRPTYSYWMRPGMEANAANGGRLPIETGYMYGKLSSSVGFDAEAKTFIGIDDAEAAMKAIGMSDIKIEQANNRGHEVLFLEAVHQEAGKKLFTAYIAIDGDATKVYFLTYASPNGEIAFGDCAWAKIRAALEGK